MEIKVYRRSKVYCFINAAFSNIKLGASQGACIFLCANKKFILISSKTKKVKRVVKSVLADETLELEETLESCFIKMFESYKREIMSYNQGNGRKHEVEKIKCVTKSSESCEKLITVALGDTRIITTTLYL